MSIQPTPTPLVSVVTPVYNGAAHLREAIASVLAQTYGHWEYVIVDNHSTDATANIIQEYAAQDERIRTITNSKTLPIMENWNVGVSAISPDAQYFRLLCADDTMMPTALEKMVALAVENPTVGVVASLRERGDIIQGRGISPEREVFSGREIVRQYLLGKNEALMATSNLIRTDLVRRRKPFYSTHLLHADTEALIDILRDCDYGFIHEILAFIRVHEDSMTSKVATKQQTRLYEYLEFMINFGPYYFEQKELNAAIRKHCLWYYRVILKNWLLGRDKNVNKKHLEQLRRVSYSPNFIDYTHSLIDKMAIIFDSSPRYDHT